MMMMTIIWSMKMVNENKRNVFGASPGKFNALVFLDNQGSKDQDWIPRRLPRGATRRRAQENEGSFLLPFDGEDDNDEAVNYRDYYHKDDDDDEWTDTDWFYNEAVPSTPPYDPPRYEPFDESTTIFPKPSIRQRRRERGDRNWQSMDNDDGPQGRRRRRRRDERLLNSDPTSVWFQQDEDGNEFESLDRKRQKRQRGSRTRGYIEEEDGDGLDWTAPLSSMVDSFFGVNRKELDRRANVYNQQMGIRRTRVEDNEDDNYSYKNNNDPYRNRQLRRRKMQRRQGHAYPYLPDDEEEEEDSPPVADYELVTELDDSDIGSSNSQKGNHHDMDGSSHQSNHESSPQEVNRNRREESDPRPRELSWEERAMAMERVPPANVRAWGPSGELAVDARTQAISDVLQDVMEGKRLVESKEQAVAQAKEQLSILRVDQELERQQILSRRRHRKSRTTDRQRTQRQEEEQQSRDDYRFREMEQDFGRASREYRLAVKLCNMVKQDLEDLERRHWAVLQCYNPTQAQELVDETLEEWDRDNPSADQATPVSSSESEQ